MALSLRRANAVKDALVREGVPATAIAVVGRGEQGLLVQTGPNVREPQNRRVEIVIHFLRYASFKPIFFTSTADSFSSVRHCTTPISFFFIHNGK